MATAMSYGLLSISVASGLSALGSACLYQESDLEQTRWGVLGFVFIIGCCTMAYLAGTIA